MSKRLQKYGYKNDYPGPGHYLRFSEFGILVPKDYRKRGFSAYNTLSTTKSRMTNFETVKSEGDKPIKKKNKPAEKENI